MTSSPRSWLLAALPVVAVLAVDPSGLAPFGPLKWALVGALVLAGLALQPGPGRRYRVARAPGRARLAFLAVVVVAAALGLDRLYAWTGTPERHFGVLAWLLCAAAFVAGQQLDEDDARFVTLMACGAALLGGGWAVAEQLGWRPLRLVGAGSRPVAGLGSSAYLGAAAALLVPVCLGVAVDPRWQRPARRVAAAGAALGTAGLVLSGARAAWVGVVVAGAGGVVVRRRRIAARRRHWRRLRSRLAVAGAVGLAFLVALAVAGGSAGRMADGVRRRDGGLRGRLDEWRVAVRVVAAHPVAGVGPEGYRLAFAGAVDDAYEQAHGRVPLPDRAHSAVLDVAATTGLPGLAAYAVLAVLVGRLLVRAVRDGPVWVAAVATGVLAYAAQSLFLFPVAELDPVAWLLAGLVVGRVAHGDEVARARRPALVPAVLGAATAVALVAGALDVAADRAARRALAATGTATAAEATRAARLRPDAVRYHLVAARALEAGTTPGGRRAAVAEVDRALRLSARDPVAAGERGRLLLDQARLTGAPADVAAARRALEALARRDPRNALTLLRLGIARDLAGDWPGAERAWLASERLAPRSAAGPTNLAVGYARAGRWDEALAAARRALRLDPAEERARRVLEAAGGT